MPIPDPPPAYGRAHREARSAWVSDHGALPALLREAPGLARYPLAAARISWAVCSAVVDARTLRRDPRVLEVGEVVRLAAVTGVLPAELAIIVLGAPVPDPAGVHRGPPAAKGPAGAGGPGPADRVAARPLTREKPRPRGAPGSGAPPYS